MAKIINTSISSDNVVISNDALWQPAALGAFLGSLYWLIATVIDPLTKSATIPSDVATIIVATTGIAVMVHYRMAQPLIIASSVALSLWGFTYLTSGLTAGEAFAWSVFLYTLGYVTFSWIARFTKLLPVLVIAIAVIILSRIMAGL